MTISPIGSVTRAAVALPPSLEAAPRRPVAVPAEGAGYVLAGESRLVIQSYGAIAPISPAALPRTDRAHSGRTRRCVTSYRTRAACSASSSKSVAVMRHGHLRG